ncbi:MAG: hypothetical protein AB1726_04125 [Planctomycetota bacterium]
MNLFCRILGHTWVQETEAPEPRWNTTKDGHILAPTYGEKDVRHFDVCRRCGFRRGAAPRRHDADRPPSNA